MAHGYNCIKELYLDRYAAAVADAGHVVLTDDHRNFGDSDGEPRQELDPWMQVRDYRNAITFVQTLDGVDPERIGIWGTSYAGGHVLVVAAVDRRVRCVVAQVPTISGWQSTLRRIAPLNPAMSHWVLARLAEKNKDNATAEREYRAAIDASNGARAWANLAGFYRHTNRFEDMDQALHTMESSPLDRPEALLDGASILLRASRDYPTAIRMARRYLALPNTVEEAPVFKAHVLLGELFEKQGDRSAAAEEYRAALAMAHGYRQAQEGLKRVTR